MSPVDDIKMMWQSWYLPDRWIVIILDKEENWENVLSLPHFYSICKCEYMSILSYLCALVYEYRKKNCGEVWLLWQLWTSVSRTFSLRMKMNCRPWTDAPLVICHSVNHAVKANCVVGKSIVSGTLLDKAFTRVGGWNESCNKETRCWKKCK